LVGALSHVASVVANNDVDEQVYFFPLFKHTKVVFLTNQFQALQQEAHRVRQGLALLEQQEAFIDANK
jgi:hypothetical protein